jgi:hypothetical protein
VNIATDVRGMVDIRRSPRTLPLVRLICAQ